MGIRDLMAVKKKSTEMQSVNRNECSLGVMCTEDGSVRYFNDDGNGVDRAKLVEMSNEKDHQTGKPVWCLPKPMEPWTGENKKSYSAIHFAILNDDLQKYIDESKSFSEQFNEKGRTANAALVEQVKIAKVEVKK